MPAFGNFTYFGSDSGSAASSLDYIKDTFKDGSLPANSNSGLTSNASNNPLGRFFQNDDAVVYASKKLLIKDIVLVQDRSLWVNGMPTYEIVWDQVCPAVKGYVYGDLFISPTYKQMQIQFRTAGGGIGVGGIIRRVAWLVRPSAETTATGQFLLDGAATTTTDFSTLSATSNGTYAAVGINQAVYHTPLISASSNETQAIHDFRLQALQDLTLRVIGVVAYFENTGANIELHPGNTYVDKIKATSTVGASLPLPTYGSSLGGMALYYKTTAGSYASLAISASTFITTATGSSGTNLVDVATGQGVNFPVGSGIVIPQGTSMYVGAVTQVSTDTLTVSPTLSFGLSNIIYRAWSSGPSLVIGSTLFDYKSTIDFTDKNFFSGIIQGIYDHKNKWSVFGNNAVTPLGTSLGASFGFFANNTNPVLFRAITSSYLQVDGYFSALDFVTRGSGICNLSVSVNGTPAYTINEGQTGQIKRPLVSDLGPGWNSVVLQPGTSHALFGGVSLGVGILEFNLYERKPDFGNTLGNLAAIDTLQAFTERPAINATLMALGTYQRVYADQMYLKGDWVRTVSAASPACVQYQGSSTNSVLQLQYYGKNFALIGTAGSSAILRLDGTSIAVTLNRMIDVASEGWHTVSYTHQGGTSIIEALDYGRTHGEMTSLQTVINDSKKTKKIRVLKMVPWTSYYPNVVGLGDSSESYVSYSQIGPILYIRGNISVGGNASGAVTIGLPPGYISEKFTGQMTSAQGRAAAVGAALAGADNTRAIAIMCGPGATFLHFARDDGSDNNTPRAAGSIGLGVASFQAAVPLAPGSNGSFYDEIEVNGDLNG